MQTVAKLMLIFMAAVGIVLVLQIPRHFGMISVMPGVPLTTIFISTTILTNNIKRKSRIKKDGEV